MSLHNKIKYHFKKLLKSSNIYLASSASINFSDRISIFYILRKTQAT